MATPKCNPTGSEEAPPSYQQAIAPLVSPQDLNSCLPSYGLVLAEEISKCPSYEESVAQDSCAPPPYTATETHTDVDHSLHIIRANNRLFPKTTDASQTILPGSGTSDSGTGSTSQASSIQCSCTLRDVLGYDEGPCPVHASVTTCGGGREGEGERSTTPCCQRDRQKLCYGYVFSCGIDGPCPCTKSDPCVCKVVLPSSLPSPSNNKRCVKRLYRNFKQWLKAYGGDISGDLGVCSRGSSQTEQFLKCSSQISQQLSGRSVEPAENPVNRLALETGTEEVEREIPNTKLTE